MMLKNLMSAASTAHALLLSVIELPDALRNVVELVRENTSATEESEFWRKSSLMWSDWACQVAGGRETPGLDLTYDGDTEVMDRIAAVVNEASTLRASVSDWRDKYDLLRQELIVCRNNNERILRELNEQRQLPEDADCVDYPDKPKTWRVAWKMLKKERRKWRETREILNREIQMLSDRLTGFHASYRISVDDRDKLRRELHEALSHTPPTIIESWPTHDARPG